MKTYDEITKARKILELPEQASMEMIKEHYRMLLSKWHPDKCHEDQEKCLDMTKKIIASHDIILDYCNHYNFSFTKEEIEKSCSAEEWWFKRFGNSPWWG